MLVVRSWFSAHFPSTIPYSRGIVHRPVLSAVLMSALSRTLALEVERPHGEGSGSMGTRATRYTETRNEVRLVGRVAAAPEHRTLPSGDELCVCRLVVHRDPLPMRTEGRRVQTVDVFDCTAWDARPRRTVAAWSEGDEVEVVGAVRRRFFRAGGRTASRVEIEIRSGRMVRRAATG